MLSGFYNINIIHKKMVDSIITEVGFIALGGLVAAIPIMIIGMVLRSGEDGNNV